MTPQEESEIGYYDPTPKKETLKQVAEKFAEGAEGVIVKTTRTMKTAVEWLIDEHFGGIDNCTPDFRFHIQQALEMEKEQRGYSEEDLFKILLDFVAFPHHDMEPRGSIIERYLNELSKKKLNN